MLCQHFSEVSHQIERIFTLWPFNLAIKVQGPLKLGPRFRNDSQMGIGHPDGVPDGSLHFRLAIELPRDAGGGAIQRCPHFQVGIGLGAKRLLAEGVSLSEHIVL